MVVSFVLGKLAVKSTCLAEIGQDIEAEEKEAIKEWLYNENKREIIKAATNGFPQWYKQQLLESSF